MQIRRFHIPEIPAPEQCVAMPPEEARHAGKVLRLRRGDPLVLLDGAGALAEAVVEEVTEGRRPAIVCRVVTRQHVPEPGLRVRLYVAPPRGKTTALVLRAAVELGVWQISPILCQYGVAKPDAGKASWRGELVTAMKQSGNPFLPALDAPCSFKEALAAAVEPGVFGAVPRDAAGEFGELPTTGELGLWIGPEGGFSPDEEDALYGRGFAPVTVGNWILRVETAVPALVGHLVARAAREAGRQ